MGKIRQRGERKERKRYVVVERDMKERCIKSGMWVGEKRVKTNKI